MLNTSFLGFFLMVRINNSAELLILTTNIEVRIRKLENYK